MTSPALRGYVPSIVSDIKALVKSPWDALEEARFRRQSEPDESWGRTLDQFVDTLTLDIGQATHLWDAWRHTPWGRSQARQQRSAFHVGRDMGWQEAFDAFGVPYSRTARFEAVAARKLTGGAAAPKPSRGPLHLV